MAAYIKFDGVDGEVTDKGHEKWTEILSFSQAMHKQGAGATGVARRRGDTQIEDIVISKLLDKTSTKLAQAVVNGKVFPKVEIHATASYTGTSRETYYSYELKNVAITSYQISGGSEDKPHESMSLNFEDIKVTYHEHDKTGKKTGSTDYTWDVGKGASS